MFNRFLESRSSFPQIIHVGPDFSQDRLLHCPTPGPTIAARLPRNRGIGVAWIGKLDEVGIQNFKTTQCIIGVLGIAVTTVGVSFEDPIQTLTTCGCCWKDLNMSDIENTNFLIYKLI